MNHDNRNIAMLCESAKPGERRSLENVIAITELRSMMRDLVPILKKENAVVIGGVLMGVYARARTTGDIDVMVTSDENLDTFSYKLTDDKFTRATPHVFNHKSTGATVEFVTPESVNISQVIVNKILDTALPDKSGLKVASLEGFIAAKLQRGIMRDQSDIVEVIKIHGPVNLDEWPLKDSQIKMLSRLTKIAELER